MPSLLDQLFRWLFNKLYNIWARRSIEYQCETDIVERSLELQDESDFWLEQRRKRKNLNGTPVPPKRVRFDEDLVKIRIISDDDDDDEPMEDVPEPIETPVEVEARDADEELGQAVAGDALEAAREAVDEEEIIGPADEEVIEPANEEVAVQDFPEVDEPANEEVVAQVFPEVDEPIDEEVAAQNAPEVDQPADEEVAAPFTVESYRNGTFGGLSPNCKWDIFSIRKVFGAFLKDRRGFHCIFCSTTRSSKKQLVIHMRRIHGSHLSGQNVCRTCAAPLSDALSLHSCCYGQWWKTCTEEKARRLQQVL